MLNDLRAALRALARSPGYTTIAIASLAAGIGACAAVFAVLNALLFAPLPYRDADRIVELWATSSPRSDRPADFLPPERMRAWLGQPFRSFDALAARGNMTALVSGAGEPARATGEVVTEDFFEILGVPARIGRTLLPPDHLPGAEPAIVLAHRVWQERFAADPRVAGRTLRVGAQTFTVVGVMPPEFGSDDVAFWVPAAALPASLQPAVWLGVARLRDGVAVAAAQAEVRQRAHAEWAADSTRFAGQGVTATPMGESARRPDSETLWVLAAAAAVLYLLGTANLANLMLVRSAGRMQDVAVRAALGGSGWRLARPLLVENAVLVAAGAVGGLVLAAWAADLVRVVLGSEYRLPVRPTVDLRVAGFAAAVALLSAALLGLEPLRALRATNVRAALQRGAAAVTAGRSQRRTRGVVVGVQVALAVVLTALVVTFGSALRSYHGMDVGYDADRVVVVVPDYEAAEYGPQRMLELGAQLAAAVERYPNVEGTALWREAVQEYPPRPEADAVYEGAPDQLTPLQRLYRYHEVSPSYFRTLGIAVTRGRGFTEGDHAGAPPVAIVNESAARVWWPGQDPIGRRLKLGRDAPWLTVVGVVEDVQGTHRLARLFAAGLAARARPPGPVLFRPLAQGGDPPPGWRNSGDCMGCEGVVIAARAAREPERVAALMRAETRRLDPRLPVLEAGTLLERQLGDPIARELRFNRRLASAGSVVALLLALLGIYGVVADTVRRRTREIGIRIALGARPRQVLAGVAREGLVAAAGGALAGLLAIVVLRRPVHRFLLHGDHASLGTAVTDAGVLAATAAALLVIALLASWAGARRATRVDPVEALRTE